MDPVILQTERLILRPWRQEDREAFACMNADPEVRRYFPSTQSREESDASAELIASHIEKKGWGLWAVEIPEAKFIGFIGLYPVDSKLPFAPAVEIGWRLAREHWGKGYATEGARKALAFAFETLQLSEVVAMTEKQNLASQRVMEKIGLLYSKNEDFEHPSYFPDDPKRHHVLYRITNN